MPGLSRNKVHQSPPTSTCSSSPSSICASAASDSIWSRSKTEDVSSLQLQKFWNGLPADARRNLLRIDKQTLFEQVRKNLYCSRCHGLLVEGFSQILMYGKNHLLGRGNARKVFPESELGTTGCFSTVQDDARDPSLHPWGGLAATRDSTLTILDCFVDGTSLEVLQNVFESARGRERERELLYPDACGGNGRGWISQGSGIYASGRGHGMKETCALHTARLSCEALVDFWSALSEETRRSLLRMKEEDFIERLMFRFDSKRFCRDCRRNVLREFKEMKELKRARKEPKCTRWFCAADGAFQYEVSDCAVQADWHESFAGEVGTLYQHFEWALGTGEGKADIFGFEDVGLSDSVEVEGLELGSISDCYITIRAWRRDGKCIELSAKAHGLKGELCVHRRLFVGDGIVSITEGESIQRFFEHAEETEDEEDEDAFDKDGNELDGEGSRSQKHAKSPELARDFLLDAATVIFKEQVEKAFREGTARQNAHSIFVCLALGLLEDRVRVACKEIATLEKQNKLLEEEEHEKRQEELRRERRKLKEKEKKLRRKEKQKLKEREKEKGKCGKSAAQEEDTVVLDVSEVRLSDDSESCVRQYSDTCNEEDAVSSRDSNGASVIELSEKRVGKCQEEAADSIPTRYLRRGSSEKVGHHRGSSDSALQERQANSELSNNSRQQCACATTFRVKGGQQICSRESSASKLSRKAAILDSRQLHVKTGSSKGGRATISTGAQKAARKEISSYTRIATVGWSENHQKVTDEVQTVEGNGSCTPEATASEIEEEAEAANDLLSVEQSGVESSSDGGGMMQVIEAATDDISSDRQAETTTGDSMSRRAAADDPAEEGLSNADSGLTAMESEAESSRSQCSESPTSKERADSDCGESTNNRTAAAAVQLASAMGSPAIGSAFNSHHPHPAVSSPEVGRNGYFGPVKNLYSAATSVMELLPVSGHIRHATPVHHLHQQHQHHPPLTPQPGFACYAPQVHAAAAAAAPWGQPRSNFMPPVFLPAAPAAFGYPRYPVPRLFHHAMRIPEMVSPPPRPSYVPWVHVDTRQALHHHHHQQQQPQHQVQVQHPLAEGYSLQQQQQQQEHQQQNQQQQRCGEFDDELLRPGSGFSLFHFGSSGGGGGAVVESDLGSASSSSEEKEDDEVVVSSKCMDRLPSGINKASMMAGEYSLFAAAPGKGFGFF